MKLIKLTAPKEEVLYIAVDKIVSFHRTRKNDATVISYGGINQLVVLETVEQILNVIGAAVVDGTLPIKPDTSGRYHVH